MAKKLILLAGLHKTGTTSIQKACRENIKNISASGYWYPLIKFQGENSSLFPENHSKLIGGMFKSNTAIPSLKISGNIVVNKHKDSFRKQFANLQSVKNQNLILVAESISTLEEDDLRDLRDYFSDLGFEIEVFCCVRKPSDWMNSMIAQQVFGAKGPHLTINQSVNKFQIDGIKIRVENILRCFPKSKVIAFQETTSDLFGPPGWFFKKIGLNLQISELKTNERAYDHQVRLSSSFNEMFFTQGDRREIIKNLSPILKKIKDMSRVSRKNKKFHLREFEVAPILPRLIEENNWLKKTFGEGFCDEEIKFSNEPVTLNDEERQYLIDNFSDAEEPIRSIVKKYIAEH